MKANCSRFDILTGGRKHSASDLDVIVCEIKWALGDAPARIKVCAGDRSRVPGGASLADDDHQRHTDSRSPAAAMTSETATAGITLRRHLCCEIGLRTVISIYAEIATTKRNAPAGLVVLSCCATRVTSI